MRIYDLAKVLGQQYNMPIKPAQLAEEFKTLPQFAEIRDTIKSHSSSIEDKYAKMMFKVYEERQGGKPAAPPAANPAKAPATPAESDSKPKPGPAPAPAPPRETSHHAPHPVAAPAAASTAPSQPRVVTTLPRPTARPAAPATTQHAPATTQHAPATTQHAPASHAGGSHTPAPPAPRLGPSPSAPPLPRPSVAPHPSVPPHPSLAPRPGLTPRPAPIAPAAGQGGSPNPALRRPMPIQPTGKASAGQPIAPQPVSSAAPPAPAAPTVHPVPPASGPTEVHARPAEVRAVAPAAPPGGVRPAQLKPQKMRPTGLASELRSSSGTTGITAAPEHGRLGMGGKAGPRTAGQPAAPPPPKFSSDSPFLNRPREAPRPRPTTGRGPEPSHGGDRRPGGGMSGGMGGGGRGDAPPPSRGGRPRPAEPVTMNAANLPEIGVMKLKGKRHRPGAGTTDSKPGKRGRVGTAESDEAAKAAKKKLRPSRVYGDADEFRRPIKLGIKRPKTQPGPMMRREEPAPKIVGPIVLTGPLTVGEFAQKLSISPADLIKKAFLKGQAITINRLMDYNLAEEIALDMEIELDVRLEGDESDIENYRIEDAPESLKPRPPIVTIMGHVDHGKTTILDYYRRSRVVEGEFGGITQHIGAYHVTTKRGDIVFLDTPGHEAFTAMRARGVLTTDIVVLVVSADDGVMPQTVEAINHAQAANVPIIVAINKIDLPQAKPERVRTELLQYNIVGTAMGGDVEFVEISAKKGTNMEELLEIISIQAEVLELKANPDRPAEGVVIESHVDPLRGAVATVLVRKGTLKNGNYFVVGQQSGRVRAMFDDYGKPIMEGGPSTPVELIGLSGAPEVGQVFLVMESEQKAREIAERREQRRRNTDLGTTRNVTLAGLHDMIQEGKIKELNIILRADVLGSVEAIRQSLAKISNDQSRVNIIHSGTGSVTESDVSLALTSNAVIIGFNVRPDVTAAEAAAREGVEIKPYRIIYELIEDVEKALIGLLDKKYKEVTLGRSEVRMTFRVSKAGLIAGCMVVSGEMQRHAKARLIRDGVVVYEGRIGSLRRVKDDVGKVAQGFECGIGLENFQDIHQGDVIETFALEEIPQELTRSAN